MSIPKSYERPAHGAVALPLVWTILLLTGVLVCWSVALGALQLANMSDLGLMTAFPNAFYVALALLVLSFYLNLALPTPAPKILALHVILLITIIHGTIPLLYDAPRYSWVYKHVGVTEFIEQQGRVDVMIDAYHNWPGFFAFSALFTSFAGFRSAADFAIWAQMFFNLIYMLPLLLIFRSLNLHVRVVWNALWLFYATNWIGQDYFAPQALGYLFHLTILGIILARLQPAPGRRLRFGLPGRATRRPGLDPSGDDAQTAPPLWPSLVLLLVTFGALVASHQLTPFMTIASVTALTLFGFCRVRTLPLLLIAMTALWDFTMASAYMNGQSEWRSSLGSLTSNFTHSLRTVASTSGQGLVMPSNPGHERVVLISKLLTVGLWALAAAGALRQLLRRRPSGAPILLACAPFPMLAFQSYGGEMLLRIYLFTLPFMALLASGAFFPAPRTRQQWHILGAGVASAVLLTGQLFAYFGNERQNHVSSDEVAATDFLYTHAPPGSAIILVAEENFPIKDSGNYYQYTYLSLTGSFDPRRWRVNQITPLANNYRKTYLVFSKGQRNYIDVYRRVELGAYYNLEKEVKRSSEFKLVFTNTSAQVYTVQKSIERQGRRQ